MDGALGTLRFCTDATFQHAYIHMRCTGTSTQMQTEEAPRHAAAQDHGWGTKIAGAVKAGAAVAASAAAIQPDAWGLQHAEVLQQDTGETTYFVAGVRSCSRCAFV